MDSTTAPKVFFSYSWKPVLIKQTVIDLATRLQSDGVHVVIDVWDLAEGHDKNVYMEQMISNPDIKKVLVFCSESYMEKANDRSGGVGTESMIISEEVYRNTKQEKFIPIILERDKNNNEGYIPTFVKSRIYIDLSSEESYEDNYEQLLRNIFDQPLHKRPLLGSPPAHLWSEEPNLVRTARKIEQIKNALIQERKHADMLIDDYYESFIAALEEDYISDLAEYNPGTADEKVTEMFGKTIDLRNNYLEFLALLLKLNHLDEEKLSTFFKNLLERFVYRQRDYVLNNLPNEHRRILTYELFLYTIAILIEKEAFIPLRQFLSNGFLITDASREEVVYLPFPYLCCYSEVLDKFKKERLKLNRVSVLADLIKERASFKSITFNQLKNADAFAYYFSLIDGHQNPSTYSHYRWFPFLSAYRVGKLPIMEKAMSRRFLDKVLPIFNVISLEDLKAMMGSTDFRKSTIDDWYFQIADIKTGLNLEKLGIYP